MPEFFNDAELKKLRAEFSLLIGDLETYKSRAMDFSKQRMRMRLEAFRRDLDETIKALPKE